MDPISIAMGLAQLAPGIIKWVTGSDKAEEVASRVVAVAESITGKTGQQAVEELKVNPDKLLEFRAAMNAMDVELEKLYLADKASARDRDVALATAGIKNRRADVLAYSAIVSLGGIGALLFFVTNIPDTTEKLLYLVLGALITIVKDVYSFEFGSSRSSQNKDETIRTLSNG